HHSAGGAAAGRHPAVGRRGGRAAVSDGDPAVPHPAAPVDIPYGFARAHGVVIAPDGDGRWIATLREGSDAAVLIEVKRYLAQPLRVASASAPDFDRLLSDHYAVDATS